MSSQTHMIGWCCCKIDSRERGLFSQGRRCGLRSVSHTSFPERTRQFWAHDMLVETEYQIHRYVFISVQWPVTTNRFAYNELFRFTQGGVHLYEAAMLDCYRSPERTNLRESLLGFMFVAAKGRQRRIEEDEEVWDADFKLKKKMKD